MVSVVIITFIGAVLVAAGLILFFHPAFGRTPKGERLERIEKSENFRNGEFKNRHTTPALTGNKGFFKSAWDCLFNKPANTSPSDTVPVKRTNLHELPVDSNVVVWLGHSSLFIQQDGKRILVDPVLTDEFPASLMLTPFKGTMVYAPEDFPDVDMLIITHDHWDHLDYGTVKRLRDRIGTVICPLGVGEHFEYWGFSPKKIVEMDWNDSTEIGHLNIHCIPARHFSGRLLSRSKSLWAGYVIEGSRRIYISGDTGYDTHFKEVAEQFPAIDLAIMENGQYSEDWKYIHMLPEDLRKAVSDLHPCAILTVHNSKFSLAPHEWDEPINEFYKYASKEGLNLWTPEIGEPVVGWDWTPRTPWWNK